MLKKHSQFFESLLFLFDLSMIAAAWLGAYGLRFGGWPVPVYHDIPPLQAYLFLGVFILPIWGAIFKGMQLYRPRRVSSHLREVGDILKASTLATLELMVTAYFLKEPEFSRVVFVYFWGLSSVGLIFSRLIFRELLRVCDGMATTCAIFSLWVQSMSGKRCANKLGGIRSWDCASWGFSRATSMKLASASTASRFWAILIRSR